MALTQHSVTGESNMPIPGAASLTPVADVCCAPRSSRRTTSRLIVPRSPGPPPQTVRDICFTLVESRDLKYFSGTWRIEQRDNSLARLIYAVEVQPQPWLPICASRVCCVLVC